MSSPRRIDRVDPIAFLRCLCTGRGLYFLGAGASMGEAPFGTKLLRSPLVDFLRLAGSFSVTKPEHPPPSRQLLHAGADLTSFDIHGRTLRPGTEDLTQELLQRAPPNFLRSDIMHMLALPRYHRRRSHNYRLFRFSPPSLFMNYNHDGLADDLLGDMHTVIAVHGSVDPFVGMPEAREFIHTAGVEYGLSIAPDNLLMLQPESYDCGLLARRLLSMACYKPQFVAIIGYSFAWTGTSHDDAVSLDCFVDHYRGFSGTVFVIEPRPERLQAILAERLHAARVVALPAHWNLLAHSYIRVLEGRLPQHALSDYCSELYDYGFAERAFPMPADQFETKRIRPAPARNAGNAGTADPETFAMVDGRSADGSQWALA